MNILYIAKHGSGGNDDEGAVAHALRELGHSVHLVHESRGRVERHRCVYDLLLFHKWYDPELLEKLPAKVKAFWYFDLVEHPDPALEDRCRQRTSWMEGVLPLVDIGFCTDGDWAAKHSKLHHLPQGADGRVLQRRKVAAVAMWDLLFVGDPRGGTQRMSWHREMAEKYGGAYCNIRSGCHGEDLFRRIRSTPIVLAPDAPVSDRYWSNRVYTMLSAGAFLLHPHSEQLSVSFPELPMYGDREQLHAMIAHYMKLPEERERVAQECYGALVARHTYKHRLQELLSWLSPSTIRTTGPSA